MKSIEISDNSWIDGKGYRKQVLASPEELNSEGNLAQVVEIEPGSFVAPHYHNYTYEFYYVIEGQVSFTINDHKQVLKTGAMMITEPKDIHSVRNESQSLFRILVFKTNARPDDTVWLEE
jgi:quercetin dioxygenase-like cupin family protein